MPPPPVPCIIPVLCNSHRCTAVQQQPVPPDQQGRERPVVQGFLQATMCRKPWPNEPLINGPLIKPVFIAGGAPLARHVEDFLKVTMCCRVVQVRAGSRTARVGATARVGVCAAAWCWCGLWLGAALLGWGSVMLPRGSGAR